MLEEVLDTVCEEVSEDGFKENGEDAHAEGTWSRDSLAFQHFSRKLCFSSQFQMMSRLDSTHPHHMSSD